MRCEWYHTKIKDILSYVVDNRGKTPPTQESGYPLLEVNAVSATDKFPQYQVVRKYVSQETYDKKFRKGHPQIGDILVPTVGTLGAVSYVDKKNCCIAQNIVSLRVNSLVCDSNFLYYVLRDPVTRKRLLNLDIGGVQPSIKVPHLLELDILLPPLLEQKKISAILSSLDDKIELNNKINENLERQAQALYKHYFPYSIDDELPDGWRIGTAGEIIEIHDSKRIPLSGAERSKMGKRIYPYYGAASLMDFVDDYIFDGKYLLLGEDGTVVDNAGYPILQYVWGQFWVNNHAHILTGKLGFNVESLYMLFKQTPVKSIVTGAVQPKISQANLRSIQVIVPPEKLLIEYNCRVEPLFSLLRTNKEENKSLTVLRDTLLPKLISGEIDVSDLF